MPYTSNPAFADGNVLSAAHLQILADNAAFLYSLISGTNTPFSSQTLTGSGDSRRWIFRHQARYLHFKFTLDGGETDEVDIRLGAGEDIEYTDATNRSGPYTWEDVIDLEGTVENPAMGSFYQVYVELDFNSAGDFIIEYFLESDSPTL